MKIISNSILPFKGFVAMTVWPFVLVRRECAGKLSRATLRHEEIHCEQQREMLAVGTVVASVMTALGCGWWSLLGLPLFYWWYVVEWLVKCVVYRDRKTAYKNVSFEREAFDNQGLPCYTDGREPLAWTAYIRARRKCP